MKKYFFISSLVLILLGCGQTVQVATIEKITPSDTIFDYDSLTAIGYKKTKKYKVEGLTKAQSAYFGFLKDTKVEYEVRFYDSHKDAVDYGTVFAEERTGEDAALKKEDATWKEGVKEARSCAGDSLSKGDAVNLGGHHIGTCMAAKYSDYIIYGNMILLCEGYEPEVSMLNCEEIINKLVPPTE
jgi:hypothetical protein